ncbi:restriction endonuclease [Enterobacter hormaechei]|uniref:restriction endonuclease n=1 Tax=Enterobacter hormaechei TaxID=158836 RepID=UPI0020756BA8|nr:restriction endonuclease [Enterobacter hormaechei]
MKNGFMHKYYDWADFENFIKELYQEEGDVYVERDVTEIDRYGAKRQTDIKITRRTRFHNFITLVECKRWKERVSRDRIDVLASSIDALGAQNGAIFTTTGYEEGAIAYAKGKGIEIFVVRDLTDKEWGLPGRNIDFYMHVISGEIRNIRMPEVMAIALVEEISPSFKIDIKLAEEMILDPDLFLYSTQNGHRGSNLVRILADIHHELLNIISGSVGLLKNGEDTSFKIGLNCEVDFSHTKYRQLRLPEAAATIKSLEFTFVAQISQSRFLFDRGENLDFAVMIESYASERRMIAHRKNYENGIKFEIHDERNKINNDILMNGSIFRVFCKPWVSIEKNNGEIAIASQKVFVKITQNEDKHQLSFNNTKF